MLRTVIENFITSNNSIALFLNDTSDLYQDGKNVLPMFEEKLRETQFNSELGNSFAELLQLSDDKTEYEQFELTDISRLFESLIKLQENNIETFISAAYFEFSVMDNPDKAKEIANSGLDMAKRKIEQLQILLKKMDE